MAIFLTRTLRGAGICDGEAVVCFAYPEGDKRLNIWCVTSDAFDMPLGRTVST